MAKIEGTKYKLNYKDIKSSDIIKKNIISWYWMLQKDKWKI